MTDTEAINIHLTNSYIESSSKTYFSGFCGALKDARKVTGRNVETGFKDESNEFGHLGSWLGIIGYLSLLDQVGGCFKKVNGPEVEINKNGIIKALKNFSNFNDEEINVIYALRNSFAHDYSLQNINRRQELTHHFTVGNLDNDIVIKLPNEGWDGVLENKTEDNTTYINLQGLGDKIEDLIQNLKNLNNNEEIEIILEGGRDELIARYSFVTGIKVL